MLLSLILLPLQIVHLLAPIAVEDHTDQGSQFTSGNFQTLLRTHKAVSSVSRKGNPYDNALMESFYRTIKREHIKMQEGLFLLRWRLLNHPI
jgi:transposase InsO family protein